jgi:hypothetical protein
VFFASRGLNASERGAFGGGGRLQKSSTKSKAAAEAAAVAAYAAAVSRGASRDAAIEEAEFLADDWSDETGLANSKASLKYLRGDDTSSDEDADAKKKNVKRFRRRGLGPLGSSKTAVVDSEDSEDDAPSQQVIFCSRTHSQLTQVVGELRSTAFGKPAGLGEEDRLVSAVAVAGRRQLCVNRDALETAGASASRLNERCLELAEEGRKAGGGEQGEGRERRERNRRRGGQKTKRGCRKGVSFPAQAPRGGFRARGGGFGDPDGHRGPGSCRCETQGVSVLRRAGSAQTRGSHLRAVRVSSARGDARVAGHTTE